MRRVRLLSALVGLALLASIGSAAPAAGAGPKSRFIVVLKPGAAVSSVASRHARTYGTSLKHVYRHTIKGYAAKLSAADVLALRSDPRVAFVEPDGVARIARVGDKAKGNKRPRGGGYSFASWGLDRIDQRSLPLSSSFTTNANGAGVTAYVIDTGIRVSHQQFGGRASHGWDFVDNDSVASDCNGHGTHVAGTIGGSTYGVARGVRLVAVRVLNCSGSGTWSGVIAGIDWVAGRASGPAVINMSLGGGANSAVDLAVRNAVTAGVTVAVAAGNSNANACNYSPARVTEAITVGATTSSDARASYSNVGSCLDLFAPGSSITSAWSTGDTATNTISGTSMASPHVAGVVALYLAGQPGASPATVAGALVAKATTGVVSGAGSGSPNRLLYTDY